MSSKVSIILYTLTSESKQIHDELVLISGLDVPIHQRLAFFADMKGAGGAQAQSEVWPFWLEKYVLEVCILSTLVTD